MGLKVGWGAITRLPQGDGTRSPPPLTSHPARPAWSAAPLRSSPPPPIVAGPDSAAARGVAGEGANERASRGGRAGQRGRAGRAHPFGRGAMGETRVGEAIRCLREPGHRRHSCVSGRHRQRTPRPRAAARRGHANALSSPRRRDRADPAPSPRRRDPPQSKEVRARGGASRGDGIGSAPFAAEGRGHESARGPLGERWQPPRDGGGRRAGQAVQEGVLTLVVKEAAGRQ